MVDAMGATLFELSLFRAVDDYRTAMSRDLDIEGEHRFLLELSRSVIERDDEYRDEYEALRESQENKPEDVDHDDWNREHNLRHFGMILSALRRAGYLDHAPVPESDSGLSFL